MSEPNELETTIRLTYHSNALEGNKLSMDDVRAILSGNFEPEYASYRDILETRSHADAMRETFFPVCRDTEILETDLKMFHRVFFTPFDRREAGAWRTQPVYVRTSTGWKEFPDYRKIQNLVSETFSELGRLDCGRSPLERAALLHFRIVSIHPFVDGNGRSVRFLSAAAAVQGGCSPVYMPAESRKEYIASLERGESAFVDFFLETASLQEPESREPRL